MLKELLKQYFNFKGTNRWSTHTAPLPIVEEDENYDNEAWFVIGMGECNEG